MADNNISGASLTPIYNRLNTTPGYHPLEADTFGDWSMEAGDMVTITRDGKSYQSPVHNSTVSWKKGQQVTVSSNGKEKREAVAKMSAKKYNSGGNALRNSNYQHWYVDDKYNQMRSGLELTGSSAHLYVNNKYTQMAAGLKLTESSAHLYVEDRYRQMQSGLRLTENSAHLYVNSKYDQMSSGLRLTERSAHLYVDNRYKQMQVGLKLTESAAHLYVNNKYDQMTSGLKLTDHSARLYVDNKYAQMKSGLDLTSSSASLYVDNKYAQMKSGLDLTESSAHLYVDSKYNQMKAGLEVTSNSAALYAKSRTTRAYIMARINANGEGEALISADKVSISGQTTLSDKLTVNGNNLVVRGGSVVASGFTYSSIGGEDNVPLSGAFKNCLASTSGNTVTLEFTTFGGTTQEVTFSRSTLVSGRWSGREYIVSADPNGTSLPKVGLVYDGIVPTGSITRNGKTVSRDFIVYSDTGEGEADEIILQKSLSIDATSVYNQGQTDKYVNGHTVGAVGAPTQSGNNWYSYATVTSSYSTGGAYATSEQIDVTAAYNAGAESASPPTSTGIYDTNARAVSSQTVNRGESIDLWGGCYFNGHWIWGEKVTISAQGNPSYNYSMYCKEAKNEGGVTKYTFTMDLNSSPFAQGSSYGFWRG